jgi:ElaB/YqjD/DUF883 family membrane-anchored ribosome-binding protein
MVKPAPGQSPAPPQDLDALLARREALLREISRIDQELGEREKLRERRRAALKELQGSVVACGDVVSPTGEIWEAEQ